MAKKAADGLGYYYKDGKLFCWRLKIGQEVVAVVKRSTAKARDEAIEEKKAELRKHGRLLKPGEVLTVEMAINNLITTKIAPFRARGTVKFHRESLARIEKSRIRDIKVTKLTHLDVQGLVKELQDMGMGGRTVEATLCTLKLALGKTAWEPLGEGLALPKKNGPRERRLDRRGIILFLDELYREEQFKTKQGSRFAYRDRNLLTLLLNTGLRIGEGLGIPIVRLNLREQTIDLQEQLDRWKDDDGNAKWGLVDLKSDSSKGLIHLNEEAMEAVRSQLELIAADKAAAGRGYEDNGLLFATETGSPGYERNVNRTIEWVLERINTKLKEADEDPLPYEHITVHDLRRSYLTQLARHERNLKVLQSIARHSDIKTTMKIYAMAEEEDRREAASKVGFGRKKA